MADNIIARTIMNSKSAKNILSPLALEYTSAALEYDECGTRIMSAALECDNWRNSFYSAALRWSGKNPKIELLKV